jgi:hypothetical protein
MVLNRSGQMDDSGQVVVQNTVTDLTAGVDGRISVTRFPVERHRNNGRVRLRDIVRTLRSTKQHGQAGSPWSTMISVSMLYLGAVSYVLAWLMVTIVVGILHLQPKGRGASSHPQKRDMTRQYADIHSTAQVLISRLFRTDLK